MTGIKVMFPEGYFGTTASGGIPGGSVMNNILTFRAFCEDAKQYGKSGGVLFADEYKGYDCQSTMKVIEEL